MKYLLILILFTSCRAYYSPKRYERSIKKEYHYIEKSDKRFASKDSIVYFSSEFKTTR